jgi:tripartite-type tricarboxylate transporter receptor subunit TctC
MKLERRRFFRLAAGAVALSAVSPIAAAQIIYPTRRVTIIVPYPAGGGADAVARVMAERMRSFLGQPVIIENVAGASGSIGLGRLARATTDGYTLGIGNWTTHVSNGAVYALPYDVVSDFEPVALIVSFYSMMVARKAVPANNLKELIAWLKANPDKAAAGTIGVGSSGHLAGILLQNITGTRFAQVPYRGNALALQDLLAGRIDFYFADMSALPQVQAGTIKALAVTSRKRLLATPEIPTVDESGLPELFRPDWNAIYAPKGTPRNVISKLGDAVANTLADPGVAQTLIDLGYEIPARDEQAPEVVRAIQKAEIEKWWPIIKAANIKGE